MNLELNVARDLLVFFSNIFLFYTIFSWSKSSRKDTRLVSPSFNVCVYYHYYYYCALTVSLIFRSVSGSLPESS